MENEIYVEGLGISSSVIETIVTLAAAEIEGVAGVGATNTLSGIKAVLGGGHAVSTGTEVSVVDGALAIGIRMQVYYGHRLKDVAAAVRETVADAILSQVGVEVASIDIVVDGVVFSE